MRLLVLPNPRGEYLDATGKKFIVREIGDTVKVGGPIAPVIAESIAAAATALGLTLAPVPPPTREQLAAKLRADLLAIFDSWTVGEQYDFDAARQALNADLERGDLARAIAGVSTFRPGDASLTDHRSAVLAVLTAAAAEFARL